MENDEIEVCRSVHRMIAAYGAEAVSLAKARLFEAVEEKDEGAIAFWAEVLPGIAKAQNGEIAVDQQGPLSDSHANGD